MTQRMFLRNVTQWSGLLLIMLVLLVACSDDEKKADEAFCTPTADNRPACPADAPASEATFFDPTVVITNADEVHVEKHSYVGPFAELHAAANESITIGEGSNVQDSVRIHAAGRGAIRIGDEVILAHGAQVHGPATLGRTAVAGAHNAAFVGFNSLIDGATVEADAMVLHLARVSPGLRIRSGWVVLSGKNITTQAQADDPANGKVIPISDALRTFMEGVLHVNQTFARTYSQLYEDDATQVTGINVDPGNADFNPTRDLPTLAGAPTASPGHRNRIVGAVVMANTLSTLNDTTIVGDQVSLRADEGEPFEVGRIAHMADHTTFHALEHTGIMAHDDITYGLRSLVHGGASEATQGNPESSTVVGNQTRIGSYAVVFRSVLGDNVRVGCASLVDGSTLPAGTNIPARRIVINRGHTNPQEYAVEWNPGCRS